ncbi:MULTISPECIES: factor-independent urate hydroxylase [Nocardiaceae]|uniref:Uricase n=1 Tax=Rhodococcoides corynebacterioides TaxID=53972 RepID=A0ABS2KQQ1_9NOCA|nr:MULTISPECIES: urate oxidase [Rhodococcus]MBM7414238.1 urate oxidase [Rhodococcus corynebacterioides]MBP1116701.1 urate oxidase [Rhodococcus sp. PvP016]
MTDLTGNIVLGANQYGKAENRVVRIYRDTARHEIRDISVSSALRGDFSAAHLVGDQGAVLPTDTQKQTAYAYAKEKGLLHLESYGLDLARHFVDDVEPVTEARIELEEYEWERVTVDGRPHDHTWVRKGQETRVASVTVADTGAEQKTWVTAGFKDLIILKSTGSEFAGFLEDSYTVLAPTHDRVMATSLEARWRYTTTDVAWDEVYAGVKAVMIEQFATLQSLALQQTLFAMGRAALEAFPFIAEIRMSAPNKHHFLYDLDRFGVENNGEVFHADDRPYGLIQATVEREDAPGAGSAWRTYSVVG